MRPRAALAAAAAVLAVAGCGGSSKPAQRTLHAPRLPFTFAYPPAFHATAPAQGPIYAQVALDPRDALAVRRTSARELDADQYLNGLRAGFARQGVVVVQRRERHSGTRHRRAGGRRARVQPGRRGRAPLHTTSYFFAGGGGTWQLECRAASRRAEVGRACRQALATLRFG